MTKDITTVDQYIAAAPAERQVILRTARQTASRLLSYAFCDHGLPRGSTTLQD